MQIIGAAYDHLRSVESSEYDSDSESDISCDENGIDNEWYRSFSTPRRTQRRLGSSYNRIQSLRPVSPSPSVTSIESYATADTSVDSEDDLPFPEMFQESARTSATSLTLVEGDVDVEEKSCQKRSIRWAQVAFETHVVAYDKVSFSAHTSSRIRADAKLFSQWKQDDGCRQGGFPYFICDTFAVKKEEEITKWHNRQLDAFQELTARGHRLREYTWSNEESRRRIQAFDCYPTKKSVDPKATGTLGKAWAAIRLR